LPEYRWLCPACGRDGYFRTSTTSTRTLLDIARDLHEGYRPRWGRCPGRGRSIMVESNAPTARHARQADRRGYHVSEEELGEYISSLVEGDAR
jgi:hypothetical protein